MIDKLNIKLSLFSISRPPDCLNIATHYFLFRTAFIPLDNDLGFSEPDSNTV